MRLGLGLLTILLSSWSAAAEVELAGIFGDHMVLQCDRPILIWGKADPGEKITVTFPGANMPDTRSAETQADENGRWRVEMGPYLITAARKLTVKGKDSEVTIHNVCVGEVWLCSGQSNMAWPVKRSLNGQRAINETSSPRLRFYTVPHRVAGEPQEDVKGEWRMCTPESIADFSAVAFYFGMHLRKEMGTPVGLIHASWGGTPAEAWVRADALRGQAPGRGQRDLARRTEFDPLRKRWDAALKAWPAEQRLHEVALAAWRIKAKAARDAGLRVPRRPRPPLGPNHPHRPGGLWNGMIAPLRPFSMRGVIWYEGESNVDRATQYRSLFQELIRDWGRELNGSDQSVLPFYFVQLANFGPIKPEPGESTWAELRDAQRHALRMPRTAMAVTIDIGEANNIHPKNKKEVGRRLAFCALSRLYPSDAENVPADSGPVLQGHEREGPRIVLKFSHESLRPRAHPPPPVGGGLRTRNDEPLRGFAIAGKDKRWYWAHARIHGKTVVCSHPRVPDPVAVRYGWADNPICNLINEAGLPASPFRTDDWPGITDGKR